MTTKPEPGQPATITVGGKTLTLRFPFRVLRDLNKKHGISLLENARESLVDPGKLALVILAGVSSDNPEITEDWILDNFDSQMLPEIIPTVAYAATGIWPEKASELLPNGLASEAASTGPNSGQSGATI
jgi:hypothetical protein